LHSEEVDFITVSRNLREEMSISKFKEGAKKWMREQIPVKPRR
jgi:hypothetical protein